MTLGTARNTQTMMGAFVDDSNFAEERKLLREVFSPETREGAVYWVYHYDQRYYKVLSACAKLRLRTRNLPEGNPTYIEIRDSDWRQVFGSAVDAAPAVDSSSITPPVMPETVSVLEENTTASAIESVTAAVMEEAASPVAAFEEEIVAPVAVQEPEIGNDLPEEDEPDIEEAVRELARTQPHNVTAEEEIVAAPVSVISEPVVSIAPPPAIEVPAVPPLAHIMPPVDTRPAMPVFTPPAPPPAFVPPSVFMPQPPIMPPVAPPVPAIPPIPDMALKPYVMPTVTPQAPESSSSDYLERSFQPDVTPAAPSVSLDERRARTRDTTMSAFRARETAIQTREEAVRQREETLRRREDALDTADNELVVSEEHITEKTKELNRRSSELDILKQKLDQEIEKIRSQKSEILLLASHTNQVGNALLKNLP